MAKSKNPYEGKYELNKVYDGYLYTQILTEKPEEGGNYKPNPDEAYYNELSHGLISLSYINEYFEESVVDFKLDDGSTEERKFTHIVTALGPFFLNIPLFDLFNIFVDYKKELDIKAKEQEDRNRILNLEIYKELQVKNTFKLTEDGQ